MRTIDARSVSDAIIVRGERVDGGVERVRVDLAALALSKVVAADADALDAYADALDAAQSSWLVTHDTRVHKAVAGVRDPLRKGRDHLFAALRTYAEDDATQAKLDEIGGVDNDDDLVNDATRLLALARKHRADLDGTDMTDERVAEVRGALADFNATRGGVRSDEGADAQAEDEVARTARRARNRAFWTLAALTRTVGKRGQYAFRDDPEKRAKYVGNRRNAGGAAGDAEPVVDPAKDPSTK